MYSYVHVNACVSVFDSLCFTRLLYVYVTQVHDDSNHKIVVNEDGFHSLIIYSTRQYDSGLYTCIARNRGGEDRFQVTLNVTGQQYNSAHVYFDVIKNSELYYSLCTLLCI